MSSTRTLPDTTEGLSTQTEGTVDSAEARAERHMEDCDCALPRQRGRRELTGQAVRPVPGPLLPPETTLSGITQPRVLLPALPVTAREDPKAQSLENRLRGRWSSIAKKRLPVASQADFPLTLETDRSVHLLHHRFLHYAKLMHYFASVVFILVNTRWPPGAVLWHATGDHRYENASEAGPPSQSRGDGSLWVQTLWLHPLHNLKITLFGIRESWVQPLGSPS